MVESRGPATLFVEVMVSKIGLRFWRSKLNADFFDKSTAFAAARASVYFPENKAYLAFRAFNVFTISIPAGMLDRKEGLIGFALIAWSALSIAAIALL